MKEVPIWEKIKSYTLRKLRPYSGHRYKQVEDINR